MAKKTVEVAPATEQRKYKSTLEFDHDLYCLENTTTFKDMSWREDMEPIWEPMVHKHFFHTFDSDGKPQTRSTATMGHYHPIQLIPSQDGSPPKIICGPASKDMMVKDKRTRQLKKTSVVLDDREAHTHEVTYRHSEKLKARKVNEEALKAQSTILAKETAQFSDEERKTIKETSRDSVVE